MSILSDYARIQSNFKRAKILIVEDSTDHWVLIKKAIQECLPEVNPIHAETPEQALKLINGWSNQEWELPQLILQDLYLPTREDGWHLLRQIKTMGSSCSRIPVVILSSSNSPGDIEEAYQRGGSSYLIKPIDFAGWLTYFRELRAYWWETTTLPPIQFSV